MEPIKQDLREPLGFCNYCKSKVFADDDHIYKKNGDGGLAKLYHVACWLQKNNMEEEVDFE